MSDKPDKRTEKERAEELDRFGWSDVRQIEFAEYDDEDEELPLPTAAPRD